jgi:hypothetical protein
MGRRHSDKKLNNCAKLLFEIFLSNAIKILLEEKSLN